MAELGFYLVAVHGGAGYHATDAETDVKRAMRLACKRALERLNARSEALDAVETAIVVLEDDPCLNAGYGSNLTMDGTVECDASLMDGRTGDFGAVGAVAGLKNPVTAARAVLNHARTLDPLRRIPPSLLVSDGAHAFAKGNSVKCVSPDALVCPRTLTEFTMWKELFDSATNTDVTCMSNTSADSNSLRDIQDTVGAIAWNSAGNLAAGVSSGGLLLKYPGRVGEAAIWGGGCWAQQTVTDSTVERGVTCSVSGSGEYIIREMLAKSICESIMGSTEIDAHDTLFRKLLKFQQHARERGEDEPVAGVLLLVKEDDEEGNVHPRLWCGFTAHSMAIAYASSLDLKPMAMLLRRPTATKDDPASTIYITALPLTR